MKRKRIVTLVASSDVKKNNIVCQILDKKPSKPKVVLIGERSGIRARAILSCSSSNNLDKVEFICRTNKSLK